MADERETANTVSDRALEMVMRDVLDGMLELSLESAYANSSLDFEIIEVGKTRKYPQSLQKIPPRRDEEPPQAADILPFPLLRKAAC